MINTDEFHDASLLKISVDWASGEVNFILKVSSCTEGGVVIRVYGCAMIEIPRKMLWGESVSVNKIIIEDCAEGYKFVIEMQSGDIIEVIGRECRIIRN